MGNTKSDMRNTKWDMKRENGSQSRRGKGKEKFDDGFSLRQDPVDSILAFWA